MTPVGRARIRSGSVATGARPVSDRPVTITLPHDPVPGAGLALNGNRPFGWAPLGAGLRRTTHARPARAAAVAHETVDASSVGQPLHMQGWPWSRLRDLGDPRCDGTDGRDHGGVRQGTSRRRIPGRPTDA